MAKFEVGEVAITTIAARDSVNGEMTFPAGTEVTIASVAPAPVWLHGRWQRYDYEIRYATGHRGSAMEAHLRKRPQDEPSWDVIARLTRWDPREQLRCIRDGDEAASFNK